MITVFHMSDALRCIMVNAPRVSNLAAPTELIVRCRPLRNSTFWAQTLAKGSNRVTVGDWEGTKLTCLASARARNGIRSWEVDRFHLNDLYQAPELLEQTVHFAGCQGAERVFLRVPYNSKLVDAARKAGFFPYFNEVHLSGTVSPSYVEVNKFAVERRTQTHLQGLFQLYSAATPQTIRQGIGMTIDQWWDSQEAAQTHRDEVVLKSDGKIVGWQISEVFGKVTFGQTLGHPQYPDSTRYLLNISYQTQNWLVPSYQQDVAESLERQGFQELDRYTMLIKMVSIPVMNREFSYVEA